MHLKKTSAVNMVRIYIMIKAVMAFINISLITPINNMIALL